VTVSIGQVDFQGSYSQSRNDFPYEFGKFGAQFAHPVKRARTQTYRASALTTTPPTRVFAVWGMGMSSVSKAS
jgi:hypothetical protein